MNQPTVLIVEDDAELRDALVTTLEMAGCSVLEAEHAEAALVRLARSPVDLVVSDVNMPGMSGHALLGEILRRFPGTPVLLMTAYGQISDAVSAMQAGAVDYLVKPFEAQVLTDTVRRVVGRGRTGRDEPVAVDPASQRMFQLARKVAACDSTVLICGESGTGKEVLARYIHQHSTRADGPFIAINCAAIPENMLEAMLFGHEKGAFTGAMASVPGKFEQANGGTLLLDEISEMDLGLQAKLLRVLQEREVERIGGRKTIALDVRVLATTNRDLRDYVRAGKFREDLYYRLSVFPMQWKPLRERPLDIVPLAEHLLHSHARKMKLASVSFDASARAALLAHAWPGNVRELDNAIQRALVLHQGQRITADDLCLDMLLGSGALLDAQAPDIQRLQEADAALWADVQDDDLELSGRVEEAGSALEQDLRQREFRIILDTLRLERGRRKETAERLGISPRTLRYKLAQMREFGIDVDVELLTA